jgi:hypothetical protein
MSRSSLRTVTLASVALVAVAAWSTTALAHSGSLRTQAESLAVPTWLFLSCGGGVVGASFLLASFATDRQFVRAVHDWRRPVVGSLDGLRRVAPVLGLLALAFVLVVGLRGPEAGVRNGAVLLVWVGWWAGLVASSYLVGNVWDAVNPFAALGRALPSLSLPYPDRLGAWPSVAGLLVLVYVEVVSPLADDPPLLLTTVAAYGALTLAGTTLVGTDVWFDRVDPVARVFRYYGRVAPLGTDADRRLSLRLPGTALTDPDAVDGLDEVAFVVAIVWVTSYDGLVTTPAWRGLVAPLGDGLPTAAAYVACLLAGYAVFLGTYLLAAAVARRTTDTYYTTVALARRFAPPLLAIAAGYHLAHYGSYLVSLWPALTTALVDPLSTPPTSAYVLPAWVGGLELAFVLVGHLVAVWIAHAAAFEAFPARLQAIRSQYPFTAVMIAYTVFGLWIVAEPAVTPP